MFRTGGANSFAPVDDGRTGRPEPLSIIPVAPSRSPAPAASPPPASGLRVVPVDAAPAEASGPRLVNVPLPPQRPAALAGAAAAANGGQVRAVPVEETASVPAEPTVPPPSGGSDGLLAFLARNAAGVPSDPEAEAHDVVELVEPAPKLAATPVEPQPKRSVGQILASRRPDPGRDQLPPGVNVPGLLGTAPAPRGPKLAALPRTQGSFSPGPSRSDLDIRPPGLRETEHTVAGMPGVFADEDAEFQCLPAGLKQVLVDVASRFGHVAILNAKRERGTGARQSYHYQCRAVDFRVRGVALASVMQYLRQHPNVGGRKLYPFGFFHVDDGPIRSW